MELWVRIWGTHWPWPHHDQVAAGGSQCPLGQPWLTIPLCPLTGWDGGALSRWDAKVVVVPSGEGDPMRKEGEVPEGAYNKVERGFG